MKQIESNKSVVLQIRYPQDTFTPILRRIYKYPKGVDAWAGHYCQSRLTLNNRIESNYRRPNWAVGIESTHVCSTMSRRSAWRLFTLEEHISLSPSNASNREQLRRKRTNTQKTVTGHVIFLTYVKQFDHESSLHKLNVPTSAPARRCHLHPSRALALSSRETLYSTITSRHLATLWVVCWLMITYKEPQRFRQQHANIVNILGWGRTGGRNLHHAFE